MADLDPMTLPTSPAPLSVTALAKQFGVSRTTIQRRLKKGWVPPVKVAPATVPPAAVPRQPAADGVPGAASAAAQAGVSDAPLGRSIPAAALVPILVLATCSAAFWISGLTSIFAGSLSPVICVWGRVRDLRVVGGRVAS
jgi:hypothetical protein